MKLRNKKTGEVVELKLMQVNDKSLIDHEVNFLNGKELTLKTLADSFDDVKEPLIKDERIRKAVKSWAEANGIEACLYDADGFSFNADGCCISFNTGFDGKTKIYTIAELCGEEGE